MELLRERPNDYWLLTQLGTVKYEQRKYVEALSLIEQAYEIAPNDPLIINDYAVVLYALERYSEALHEMNRILDMDIEELAYGKNGEGMRWAKSIQNDMWYRRALLNYETGMYEAALADAAIHLQKRQRGIFSNFSKKEVEKFIRLAASPSN